MQNNMQNNTARSILQNMQNMPNYMKEYAIKYAKYAIKYANDSINLKKEMIHLIFMMINN